MTTVLLIAAGVLAGFVDSIAGGGGLIALPSLGLVLGLGPHAIGTNKIVGSTAALVALFVYSRRGHMDWSASLVFAACTALGSLCGSLISPHVPAAAFRIFLAVTCPIILWIVWRKDLWVQRETEQAGKRHWRHSLKFPILLSGFACGVYDGLWGPGGGTFMFLSLFFAGKLPLLTAISAAKFANASSALMALTSYGAQGYVHVRLGVTVALGVTLGAFIGANHASRKAARAVRPVLAVVALLLVLKYLVSIF